MKTTKRVLNYTLAVFFAGALLLSSCKKEKEEEEVDTDTQSSKDNTQADLYFNDVANIADEASEGDLVSYKTANLDGLLSNCANITRLHADSTNSDTLLISFGSNGGTNSTVNCLCADGRLRRGIITVIYTGKYRDSLSTHNISFSNYFVNNNQLIGSKTVTNKGRNSAGHPVFEIVVNGTLFLANSGGTVTWNSNRTREWIAGYTTFGPGNWNDDVYLIRGTASGTNAAGNTFNATIINPLERAIGCRWFRKGTVEFTPSGKATRTIDYGTGNCDDIATVTINGNTHTINLN